MLTQNPNVRKEITNLADTADSAIRRIRHAAHDTREAAGPIADEMKALIVQLQHTIEVLASEGSVQSLNTGRRLRELASELTARLRAQAGDSVSHVRERMDGAVEHAQLRVAESPLKAIGLAAAIGALIGLLLATRHRE